MKVDQSFFLHRNVTTVAKLLLGKILVTKIGHEITAGMIVETEAYSHKEKGSHAFKGMTKRNEVMFENGGVAYVYLCYGVHEMFNIVTNEQSKADAVLIRALEPLEGNSPKRITSGPGKLAKAMAINRKLNGKKLDGNIIWIEDRGIKFKTLEIAKGPRIGIDYAGEDALLPWRFTIRGNEWVSSKFKVKSNK